MTGDRTIIVIVPPDQSPSITCRACGMKSYNPNDIRECYCGRCHRYHEQLTDFVIELPARDGRKT